MAIAASTAKNTDTMARLARARAEFDVDAPDPQVAARTHEVLHTISASPNFCHGFVTKLGTINAYANRMPPTFVERLSTSH